jgi:hypothetical protein
MSSFYAPRKPLEQMTDFSDALTAPAAAFDSQNCQRAVTTCQLLDGRYFFFRFFYFFVFALLTFSHDVSPSWWTYDYAIIGGSRSYFYARAHFDDAVSRDFEEICRVHGVFG